VPYVLLNLCAILDIWPLCQMGCWVFAYVLLGLCTISDVLDFVPFQMYLTPVPFDVLSLCTCIACFLCNSAFVLCVGTCNWPVCHLRFLTLFCVICHILYIMLFVIGTRFGIRVGDRLRLSNQHILCFACPWYCKHNYLASFDLNNGYLS